MVMRVVTAAAPGEIKAATKKTEGRTVHAQCTRLNHKLSVIGNIDRRIGAALEIIDKCLADRSLSAQGVSSQIGLSPSRFRQLFKLIVGTSFKQYVIELRLVRSHELLIGTFLSVKEVMKHVGVSDGGHFAKKYKKKFLVVPSTERILTAEGRSRIGRTA
jgi:AraC-like DNA-binding protein